MKTLKRIALTIALLAAGLSGLYAQAPGYHILDSLTLGGEGGWDYLLVDTSAERLYVSRGMRLQVVDLTKLSLIGEVPNTPGIHGVALVPSLTKAYTSNGRDSSATIFDMRTLKAMSVLKIQGRNPDAIVFDPLSNRVFTMNGGSDNTTAIDVSSDSIAGVIALQGKPEFAVTDGTGRIFVNLEDKSIVAEIDTRTLQVVRTWSISPGEEPSGLAMDRKNGRLFSGCANQLMVISDAKAGKVIATVPIGRGVDATAFDPETHLAFSSNGEGTLSVISEDSPGKFRVLENAVTRPGARTLALDEKTHRIYTVTARFGPAPAPTPDRPHARPAIIPGSQTLYVIGR